MKVLGFSIVTDMCLPDALKPVKIEEIIAVANTAEAQLRTIVTRVLERWSGD
jgi:purine-nucleoside phosphorylase